MTHRLLDVARIRLLAGLTFTLLAPLAAFAQAQPNLLAPEEEISPRQVQTAPAVKPKPKRKPAPGATVVTCGSGLFAKDSSHVKLAEFFQAENIAYGEVEGAGGSAINATILFPKDAKRRLEVLWQNEAARSDIATIAITGQSQWKGPNGLRLGLTIAALEKLNGRPFRLSGFDQPDGARALDWMGGALANLPGGCQVGMKFSPDRKTATDVLAAAAGKERMSSDPAVRAVKPTVSEIILGYQ